MYSSDEEKDVKILKPAVKVNISELPSNTVNPGLDAARMLYLFEEVRPYCRQHVWWTKSVHVQIFQRQ